METDLMWQNPFRSFWMAGYECTDQLNAFGNRVDFLQLTGHLQKLSEDYENLSLFGMKTVREGIRWSQVEKQPYRYDWQTVAFMIEAGRKSDSTGMGHLSLWVSRRSYAAASHVCPPVCCPLPRFCSVLPVGTAN